uniref:Regulator of chromosome condensation protein n=1 Tax=Pithovirus LCPAC202 TaxID=2506592 RepID=A0A481Z7P2_9VIRU|nr:MAG: regulator of chromosome condensation protein [Pithovirus LCPAC202]
MEPSVPLANLAILPTEILTMILLETNDIDTLGRWCLYYKPAAAICQDDRFWKQKYRKDYGEILFPNDAKQDQPKISWKRRYKLTTKTLRSNSPISAGLNHYGVIDQNGVLYMAGENRHGQLGNGSNIEVDLQNPIMIPFKSKVISISCYDNTTATVTEDGKVYYWGGETETIHRPREAKILPKAVKVSVSLSRDGNITIIIIGRDNLVYFWSQGKKKYDRISVLPKEHQSQPVLISSSKEIKTVPIVAINIIQNNETLAIIDLDGNLYLEGRIPGTYEYNNDDGYLDYFEGKRIFGFTHFPLPEPIKQVSLGDDHIAVLTITGRIYSWGTDHPIQQSQDISEINKPKDKMGWTFKDKISYIAAGNYLTAFITESGGLYIWGDNLYQQITNSRNKIVSSGNDPPDRDHHCLEHSLVLLPTLFGIRFPVNYIDFGDKFTIAVTNDGAINLWGTIQPKTTISPLPHDFLLSFEDI